MSRLKYICMCNLCNAVWVTIPGRNVKGTIAPFRREHNNLDPSNPISRKRVLLSVIFINFMWKSQRICILCTAKHEWVVVRDQWNYSFKLFPTGAKFLVRLLIKRNPRSFHRPHITVMSRHTEIECNTFDL